MANFENRLSHVFHNDGNRQFRLKLIYHGSTPWIGFSQFFRRGELWFPGKKHFFMPMDAWKGLREIIHKFSEEATKGMRPVY